MDVATLPRKLTGDGRAIREFIDKFDVSPGTFRVILWRLSLCNLEFANLPLF
jgi:hypothetical protein